MSSSYRSRRVHCSNDCRQEGCPGHELKIHYHHTSDTVTIYLDDQVYTTFDDGIWSAVHAIQEEYREEYRGKTPSTSESVANARIKDAALDALAALRPFADHVHDDGVSSPYPEDMWTPLLIAAKDARDRLIAALSDPPK